jgi:HlyD family secretion protein
MKKIKLGLLIAIVSLVTVGLAACRPQTAQIEVQKIDVIRGDVVQSVDVDGSLSLVQDRKLIFDTSGEVVEVRVKEGDRITQGQVLASLDVTPLEYTLKAAEQAVKTAEQGVKTAGLAMKTPEIALKAAEIDLELANNSFLELTSPYPFITYRFIIPESVEAIRIAQQYIKEAQVEFQEGLEGNPYSITTVNEKLIKAQERLDEAEEKLAAGLSAGIQPVGLEYWTLREVQLQVDKAKLALDKAENDLEQARNNVDIAENNLDKATTELDRITDEMEKAVLFAPFDGIIASVNVEVGDIMSSVSYATTAAFEIIDPTRMELKADVDEMDIPEVQEGQRVVIEVDALPDVLFDGEVTFISPLPKVEGGLVLYSVTVGFDVPEGSGLKAGMSATADIIIEERHGVLLVPNRAITLDSSGNPTVKVMVNEQTQERQVVIGISDGFNTEIVSGLSDGEVVVIEKKSSPEPTGSGGFLFGD